MSDAYRLLIEKLLSGSLFTNPSKVTSDKSHSRRCYMKDNAEVSIAEVCERCRITSRKEYFDCPEVQKALGIDPKKQPTLQKW